MSGSQFTILDFGKPDAITFAGEFHSHELFLYHINHPLTNGNSKPSPTESTLPSSTQLTPPGHPVIPATDSFFCSALHVLIGQLEFCFPFSLLFIPEPPICLSIRALLHPGIFISPATV